MKKLFYIDFQDQLATNNYYPLNLSVKRYEHHITSKKDHLLKVRII